MRGYPKNLNTKQDIINIKNNHLEFREMLNADIQRLLDEPDTVKKATTLVDPKDESKGYNTIDIPNPQPKWEAMGFKNKENVVSLKEELK
jgi:hypothetical protein